MISPACEQNSGLPPVPEFQACLKLSPPLSDGLLSPALGCFHSCRIKHLGPKSVSRFPFFRREKRNRRRCRGWFCQQPELSEENSAEESKRFTADLWRVSSFRGFLGVGMLGTRGAALGIQLPAATRLQLPRCNFRTCGVAGGSLLTDKKFLSNAQSRFGGL